jgi:hypothetical protein
LNSVLFLSLSEGIYNEPTISISDVTLVIRGNPNLTVFDCSRRQGTSSGPAFVINNSSISISGIIFQNCSNSAFNGGAISVIGSSVVLSQCSFIGCRAPSGGAVSVTGRGRDEFLRIQNSTFITNFATGGSAGCPEDLSEPCSTWGGAVAAFEMYNVSISGCIMINNVAVALVPQLSIQSSASKNAVAGGGCISVMFRGNASGPELRMSSNTFVECRVEVSGSNGIVVGNGVCAPCSR